MTGMIVLIILREIGEICARTLHQHLVDAMIAIVTETEMIDLIEEMATDEIMIVMTDEMVIDLIEEMIGKLQ